MKRDGLQREEKRTGIELGEDLGYVVCEEGPVEPAEKGRKEKERNQEKECCGSQERGDFQGWWSVELEGPEKLERSNIFSN